MKAIILSGGAGKRMKPIEKDKNLLKFMGKELLLHQIEKLERVGINDITIICSPNNIETIKNLVGGKAGCILQKEPKGMADALLSIGNPPEQALVICSNDIFDEEAYKKVLEKEGDSVILGYRVREYFPGGYLITEGDRMKGVMEKPGEGNEPSNLVNIVVHLHRKFHKFVEYMKNAQTDRDDQYEVAMDNMIKEGFDFRVVPYHGAWTAIKFPHHVLKAAEYFLDRAETRISPNAQVSDKATLTGKGIVIEDGVKVFENAVIRGPCYIGKNCVIGNGSLICGKSHLNDGVVVGFSTEVKHSYVGDNVWLHQNYVGDSIIMDGSNLGARTMIANWRFDEKHIHLRIKGSKISTGTDKFGAVIGENCKTGINVSIMPGVRIGSNSFIGAHVFLSRDVDPNKLVLLKQEHIIQEENPFAVKTDKAKLLEKLMKGKEDAN